MNEEFNKRLETVYVTKYTMYYRLALRLLRMYTGQTDYAMDIVHEAFVRAEQKQEQSGDHLEKWLSKTIRYLCRNYQRVFITRQEKQKEMAQDIGPDLRSFESATDLIVSLQQHLSEEDYHLILQYYVERTPIEIISRETGLTPNAIRVRVHRIKKIAEKIILLSIVIFLNQ